MNTEAKRIDPQKEQSMMLHVGLPDWFAIDDVVRSSKPFALWRVGDQYLIHHWLDYALNQGYKGITFYCSDRPDKVRAVLEDSTLWPIECHLCAVQDVSLHHVNVWADHLPMCEAVLDAPHDGWSLLNYWVQLNMQWLDAVIQSNPQMSENIGIGRFCSIHPTAILTQPVWIGDRVSIGPGCHIGPYVCIGDNSILVGPSDIRHAIIAANTFLAGHTELESAYLAEGRLLNLKHKADVKQLDFSIAGPLVQSKTLQKPSIRERLLAFWLWLKYAFKPKSKTQQVYTTFNRLQLCEGLDGPLAVRRHTWFMEVVRGRMRLIGVHPRTAEQLKSLSDDWHDILQSTAMGVFSYADLNAAYTPDYEMEALHAVYQATQPRANMEDLLINNLKTLLIRDPDEAIL